MLSVCLVSPGYSSDFDIKVVSQIETGPDLSGTWVLDEATSDDPEEKLKEFREQMGKSGKSRGRMGAASSPGSGPAGGMRGGAHTNRSKSRIPGSMPDPHVFETLNKLISAPRFLELAHQEPELIITRDGERSQRLYSDNRGSTISLSKGVHQAVTVAGWENEDLVVETTRDGAPRIVQRFRLTSDANQLSIITEFTPPGLSSPVIIHYNYTRVEANAGSIQDTDT